MHARLVDILLLALSTVLLGAFIMYAVYSFSTTSDLVQDSVEDQQRYISEISTNTLFNMNGQSLVGTEVKNLIKQHGDGYIIRLIDGESAEIYKPSDALSEIESTWLYKCTLMRQTGDEWEEPEDASRATTLAFSVQSRGNSAGTTEEETIDWSSLDALGITETGTEAIEKVAAIIAQLQQENSLLAQNKTYELEQGIVTPGVLQTVTIQDPSDVLLWRGDGVSSATVGEGSFYWALGDGTNLTIPTGENSVEKSQIWDNITITVERVRSSNDDDHWTLTIRNNSENSVNYRVFRITEN